MLDHQAEAAKEVEFYAASVNAWYASALEHDKSILALAGGGIAVLITLLTTVGFAAWVTFGLFVAAIVSFLVTLAGLLVVFRRNQAYLEKVIKAGGPIRDDKLLQLDAVVLVSFGSGVLLASAVGVSAALDSFIGKLRQKEAAVANENSSSKPTKILRSEDLLGSEGTAPTDIRSYHGAGNLRPRAPTAEQATSPSVVPTAAEAARAAEGAQATQATQPAQSAAAPAAPLASSSGK